MFYQFKSVYDYIYVLHGDVLLMMRESYAGGTYFATGSCIRINITKTRLFKCIENFNSKNWKFSDKKNSDIFHISVQNIDCGYSLEPPRRGGSNEYP